MTLRIGFLTTLGVNVGDEFIREGIRAVLDRTAIPYRPFYVNKHDPRSLHAPAEDEVEILGDKFWDTDLFIQSGAPVYWHLSGGQHTSLTSEWHDWFWVRRALRQEAGAGPVFLNLGAGACDPWGGSGADFLGDPGCVNFAKDAARRSAATVVRDPVASHVLRTLGVDHHALPCPAFLAGARHQLLPQAGQAIGVNLMPLGGHFDFTQDFDASAWREQCHSLTRRLRGLGPLVFICHDQTERDFAAEFAIPGERIFFATGWRSFLDMYAQCAVVVANRVHGAVVAAGLGVPSVILGTDTRARIGDYIGLPSLRSGRTSVDAIFDQACDLFKRRRDERDRLTQLRDQALSRYVELLAPIVRGAAASAAVPPPGVPSTSRSSVSAAVRLASLPELTCGRFQSFVADVDAFAAAHGLRVCAKWSTAWEYPWLWSAVLGKIDWRGKRLVDLGTELSPIPWLLARLGAHVTLIETHPHLVPTWEKLRAELGVQVDFQIATGERLSLPDASVDVVTSFSVIEHQPNKQLAIDEVARALKPGGVFAVSFDICEPDMGMTFPEWNGRALTMREFETLAWLHPAFGNSTAPRWNTEEIPAYLDWHRRSAPHHNYATAAAVLVKKS